MVIILLTILFVYNNNGFPLITDNVTLGMYFTFIGPGLAIDPILAAFIKKWITYTKNPEEYRRKKEARVEINRLIKSELTLIDNPGQNESWGKFADLYDLYLPKKFIVTQKDEDSFRGVNWKGSYLLRGKAGSGKTTYLKRLFRTRNEKWYFRICNWLFSQKILYFRADNLLEKDRKDGICDQIKNARYHRIFLICDSLDELGEDEGTIQEMVQLFRRLHEAHHKGKLFLLVSGREKCIQKYLKSAKFSELFLGSYEVKCWSAEDIAELLGEIQKKYRQEEASAFAYGKEEFAEIVDHNPMLCKMYCIAAGNNREKDFSDSFVLYYEFFQRLFEYECQRVYGGTLHEEEAIKMLEEMGGYAFIKYKKCLCNAEKDWKKYLQEKRKTWNESQSRMAGMILERQSGEFLHHSYEEFFVALHYILHIIDAGKDIRDITDVLSCLYNNAYSDFISKGLSIKLDKESEKRKVTQALLYVYYFTLQGKLQQELLLLTEYKLDAVISSVDKKQLGINKRIIKQLEEREYLYLKYEIPFRLGRLGTTYPLEFLRFVYMKENGKEASGGIFDAYKLTILKRQCAISASFLCGSEVELDYVKKMLPYMPQYDRNYDLVNRSHTLIYYGDVLNTDLLEFRDDGSADWSLAREKRIQRLEKQVKAYTVDDRAACFRLFDLATLYTFLFSRQASSCLSEEEKNVIHSAKTKGIPQMPLEREELMCQLKNKIVQDEYHL